MTDLPDRFDPGPPLGPAQDPIVDADATHLQLDERLTIDDWKRLGAQILERREASDWWVGDWLEFGWSRFATDPDTGEEISHVAAELRSAVSAMTTLDLDVLRAARDTARRVPPRRRRRTLSFAHHQQVLALDDRQADELLDLAEAEGLESADLKAVVRKASAVEGAEADDPAAKPARARLTIKAGVGERDEAVVAAAAAAAESAALEVLAQANLTAEVTVS